jgi:hypothetical protein
VTERDDQDVPVEPEQRLDQLDQRVRRIERFLWGADGDADEHGSDGTNGTADRNGGRGTGGLDGAGDGYRVGEVALDQADPELTRLAEAAQRAHELTTMLASPDVRAACEQAIEAWNEWHRRHQELLECALSASRTIAFTSEGHASRQQAIDEFTSARARLATLQGHRQGCLNAATHARRQLDRDQQVRDRSQDEIDAGHLAWVAMNARLRTQLATALGHGAPLPAWLVMALGPAPTSHSARWRDLAVELLAYRITYAVTDRAEPLGPEPTSDDSPRRRQWHGELRRALDGWANDS